MVQTYKDSQQLLIMSGVSCGDEFFIKCLMSKVKKKKKKKERKKEKLIPLIRFTL